MAVVGEKCWKTVIFTVCCFCGRWFDYHQLHAHKYVYFHCGYVAEWQCSPSHQVCKCLRVCESVYVAVPEPPDTHARKNASTHTCMQAGTGAHTRTHPPPPPPTHTPSNKKTHCLELMVFIGKVDCIHVCRRRVKEGLVGNVAC